MRFIPAGAGNTVPAVQVRSRNSVYPRWRGEHADIRCASCCSPGLSPLARGTPSAPEHGRNITRFIPAGARNTPIFSKIYSSIAVYPRWRGEHTAFSIPRVQHCGLSPLARGTLVGADTAGPGLRFIPAGAGNTSTHEFPLRDTPVYPRWRGEHFFQCQ